MEEIKTFWEGRLIKVLPDALEGWHLPESTVLFLLETGLPVDERLAHNPNFMMEFTPLNLAEALYGEDRHLTIGQIGRTKITIKENTGEVFLFSEGNSQAQYVFMNSSIEQLLLFLKINYDYLPKLTDCSNKLDKYFYNRSQLNSDEKQIWLKLERERSALFREMLDKLCKIDSTAFREGGNFWVMDFDLTPPKPDIGLNICC